MFKYVFVLLIAIASVCHAHEDWKSGSTDRSHLPDGELKGYLHGHSEVIDGTTHTGYWDFDPDADGDPWTKKQGNWEKSGCVSTDANGKKLYDHDCYNDWIKEGNLKPTSQGTTGGGPGGITDDDTTDDESTDDDSDDPTGDESDDPTGDESDDPTGDESDDPTGDDSDDPTGDESDDPTDDESDDPTGNERNSLDLVRGTSDNRRFVPQAPILNPLMITEWMLIDTGRSHPQWIELYNPNNSAVNLNGYTFVYVTYHHSAKWTFHTITLSSFMVPAKSAIILTSHDITDHIRHTFQGIKKSQIYHLNINGYHLKSGWLIKDADENELHRTGKAFREHGEDTTLHNPLLSDPPLVNPGVEWNWRNKRVSYKRYPSEEPEQGEYYYGSPNDVSSPGYFESARAAPSLIRPKKIGTWAALKRR